jgi:sigma-E factor negative regulatory protein RseC
MKDPQGTIVEIIRDSGGVRAIVEVEPGIACARCAAGRGCGAGILSGRAGNSRLEVAVDHDLELGEGDAVNISLAQGNVLRAAMYVYGLPLAGAAAAALLAYVLALGDGGAAAMALAGLLGGAMISRYRLTSASCLARFTPTVSRHVGPGT